VKIKGKLHKNTTSSWRIY